MLNLQFPSNIQVEMDSIRHLSDRLYICKAFETITQKQIYILTVETTFFALSQQEFQNLLLYQVGEK